MASKPRGLGVQQVGRGYRRTGQARDHMMEQKLREINGGRTLLMNAGAFFCVVAMLGIANLICRFVLHTDVVFLMPWLLAATGLFFFLPALMLWLMTGKPSGS
ncbi:hypothetical protein [Komagataeibacter oboediens]